MDPLSEKKLLRNALGLYAGEHVLEKVLKDGEEFLRTRPDNRELTMLFMDVVPYTELNQGISTDQFLNLLQEYYEVATKTVSLHGGIFDSFVGDSASAFWGSDGDQAHPTNACRCAVDLIEAIDRLNSKSKKSNHCCPVNR